MSIDFNSSINQEVKSKFVDREVHCCVSDEVEFILKSVVNVGNHSNVPYSWDDVSNVYVDNSDEIKDLQDNKEFYEDRVAELEDKMEDLARVGIEIVRVEYDELETDKENLEKKVDEIDDKITELKSEEDDVKEVLEWWKVTPWLCRKLKEWDEVVIESHDIWGRQTSGQAIKLDEVMNNICNELKMFEAE